MNHDSTCGKDRADLLLTRRFTMNSDFKTAAASTMAPNLIRGFRFSWLLYGAAAYFGLKYLNKSGILTKQTGAALDFIDQGIDTVKEKVGFNYNKSDSTSQSVRH